MSKLDAILKQSDMVQSKKSRKDRKNGGVFYTPFEVVGYMAEKALKELDPAADPYLRILDPACGTGLFLIKAFGILKQKFEDNYESIIKNNAGLKKILQEEGLGKFIVENNLWGADIDREALDSAANSLKELAGRECKPNLLCCDSLIAGENEFWDNSYDYVIGNPPYIGHKKVSGKYKKTLQQLYKGIYRDKSDISYCFIKRGIDLLKEGGTLSFITSRYFIEGPSAAGLRNYISSNCTVTDIVDFYGRHVFEDAGVAVCIITLIKGQKANDISVYKGKSGNAPAKLYNLLQEDCFEHFIIGKENLRDGGWILVSPEKNEIFNLVENRGTHTLGELFESYQGIITGCDRAFILNSTTAREYNIEKSLLRPWIKNSNIEKYSIKPPERYVIYSNFIKNEEDYPNAIKFIGLQRDKLMERRECKRGVRKWYELQWGRKNEVFEAPKIIYPYKSASNRFAVDESGYYCSADIYCLQLKREFQSLITLEYAAAILNSKLFEFYFKCYAKKISSNLYDYYPNTVLRLKLMAGDISSPVLVLAKELKNCKNEEEKKNITDSIDREIYNLYGINKRQIEMVEKEIL
ncbi:MAG: Eco57I restriction-modification methylase domain-containing protein [Caulobacteraceae bacterium]